MGTDAALGCFAREWAHYLQHHGHRLSRPDDARGTLRSVNGQRQRYRWVLLTAEEDSLLLSDPQRKHIRSQARLARRARERCYVVVKFGHPGGKALAVPAEQALAMRRLRSDWAGIPWDC